MVSLIGTITAVCCFGYIYHSLVVLSTVLFVVLHLSKFNKLGLVEYLSNLLLGEFINIYQVEPELNVLNSPADAAADQLTEIYSSKSKIPIFI